MGLFRDKIMKENNKQPRNTENINTIYFNTKKSISVSKNQPNGFGWSFKRFYIFKKSNK